MPKPSDYDKTHLRNMAAIGTRIDRIFKKAADEAAKIGVQIKELHPERLFSFDDYPETKKQIERLMAALQQSTETVIANGVRSAWTLSNNKNNALARRLFGERAASLTEEQARRYFSTNGAALDAFLQRRTDGLKLSNRVWRYTQEFKEEIELGLDLGIRSGKPAAEMARDLRQYLQHPDMMFRRFRVKVEDKQLLDADGNPIIDKFTGKPMTEPVYGRRWKKRVTHPDGSHTWVNFDPSDFHPGQGVYRSSYKNARRLAVTETNIAYRTSDHLRWQQMDFVVGIRVVLSNNHKLNGVEFYDICDRLSSTKPGDGKGLYPKDFKFVGWHPHCRCHVETVLKTEEEMQQDTQRILSGEPTSTDSVNKVRDTPPEFKDFANEFNARNEERAANGLRPLNTPYFIRDNKGYFDRAIGIEPEVRKTPQEIAEERWAIQEAWNKRRIENIKQMAAQGLLPKESVEGLESLPQEELNERIAFLQKRAAKHAERTPEDIKAIKDAWKKTKKRHALIVKKATTVRDLGYNFGVDLDADLWKQLDEAIKNNNLNALGKLTKAVSADIKKQQLRLQALKDGGILADLDTFYDGQGLSLSQLEFVEKTIKDKLEDFKKKGWGDFATKSELGHLKHSLEWQAKYMAKKGMVKFPDTWEVAHKAYLHLVDKAQDLIEWENIEKDITLLQGFKTKDKEFQDLLDKAIAAHAAGDKKKAQSYVYNAGLKKSHLEAKETTRATTRGAVTFGDECFTESRRKAAKIFDDAMEAEKSELFDDASRLYQAATRAFKEAAEEYTYGSGYLTKFMRGIDGYLEESLSYAQMAERHAKVLTEVIGQAPLQRDMWLYRDERAAFLALKAGGFNPDTLQAQIEKYTLKITARYKAKGRMTAKRKKELQEKIEWFTDWRARQLVGRHGIDPSILSCGSNQAHSFSGTGGDNKYNFPKVRLEIYCPKGTQAMYAAPFNHYNGKIEGSDGYWNGVDHTTSIHEAEIFLQRDTEFRIIKARWDAAEDRWFVKVEVLGHHNRDFELESTSRGYKAKFK